MKRALLACAIIVVFAASAMAAHCRAPCGFVSCNRTRTFASGCPVVLWTARPSSAHSRELRPGAYRGARVQEEIPARRHPRSSQVRIIRRPDCNLESPLPKHKTAPG